MTRNKTLNSVLGRQQEGKHAPKNELERAFSCHGLYLSGRVTSTPSLGLEQNINVRVGAHKV